MAAVVAGESAEDVCVGVEPWLCPGDHRAADARLRGDQAGLAHSERLSDPLVLDPTLGVEVDQDVRAEPTRIPDTVRIVATEKGARPFRVHIDPADDGAEEVFTIGDRVRTDFYDRIGLEDLLSPTE